RALIKPYQFLEGDTLSPSLSPERGALFIALVNSNLDSLTRVALLNKMTLANADLRKGEFIGVDLAMFELSYAELSYADLDFADLSFTNLSYANLRGAKLFAADLRSADLCGADLSGANLRSAYLRIADKAGQGGVIYETMKGTKLTGAKVYLSKRESLSKVLTEEQLNSIDWVDDLEP
ncbi:MAG: pentapeptide repeat-containing protein, partial [Bacteroidota bacterium]